MKTQEQFQILIANESHLSFAQIICDEMASSAKARGTGIAKRSPEYIQQKMREGKAVIAFNKEGICALYPEAKIFGLTTGLAVMKINSELGYEPVTYSELTQDEAFWAGCKNCVNYDVLMSKERKNCFCTAMLYDPKDHSAPEETKEAFRQHSKLYERFMRIKKWKLLQPVLKKDREESKSRHNMKTILHFFFNL